MVEMIAVQVRVHTEQTTEHRTNRFSEVLWERYA